MFYHARIRLKPENAKAAEKIAWEPDLSREDIIVKIAVPFIRQTQFYCGGTIINPGKVEEIKFNETSESAEVLLPRIRARMMNSGVIGFTRDFAVAHEGKDVTREILEEAQSRSTVSISASAASKTSTPKKSDRVFVVHGHDLKAVDQTELVLHRFGLEPVILKDAPSGGRTVIEKFEAHANVGAAIVLLTPDDVGGKDEKSLSPRARQNVIWEWGYLVSRLGRVNVICIFKGGVEIPSDLNGIVTIHIADDVREKTDEIRRELNAAGYQIS